MLIADRGLKDRGTLAQGGASDLGLFGAPAAAFAPLPTYARDFAGNPIFDDAYHGFAPGGGQESGGFAHVHALALEQTLSLGSGGLLSAPVVADLLPQGSAAHVQSVAVTVSADAALSHGGQAAAPIYGAPPHPVGSGGVYDAGASGSASIEAQTSAATPLGVQTSTASIDTQGAVELQAAAMAISQHVAAIAEQLGATRAAMLGDVAEQLAQTSAALAEQANAIGTRADAIQQHVDGQLADLGDTIDGLTVPVLNGVEAIGGRVAAFQNDVGERVSALADTATNTVGALAATAGETVDAVASTATHTLASIADTATETVDAAVENVGMLTAPILDEAPQLVGTLIDAVPDVIDATLEIDTSIDAGIALGDRTLGVAADIDVSAAAGVATELPIGGGDVAGGIATLLDMVSGDSGWAIQDEATGTEWLGQTLAPIEAVTALAEDDAPDLTDTAHDLAPASALLGVVDHAGDLTGDLLSFDHHNGFGI